jgi:nucleotide-binding universal stress UspA family protein
VRCHAHCAKSSASGRCAIIIDALWPTVKIVKILKARHPMKPLKILLAVDGSAYTKRMLGWVAAHDEFFDPMTEYTVFTAVAELPPHSGFFELGDLKGYYAARGEQVLAPVRAFMAQKTWRASFEQRIGPAAELIADEASKGEFDLIVLGSHGHSALANLALGSVATGVLARCKTPVLLIR